MSLRTCVYLNLSGIWKSKFPFYQSWLPYFIMYLASVFLQRVGTADNMKGAKAGGINGVCYNAGIKFFIDSNVWTNYENILNGYIINTVIGAITRALNGKLIRKIRWLNIYKVFYSVNKSTFYKVKIKRKFLDLYLINLICG